MRKYPYKFETYKGKKNTCPECNKKSFVLFIDTETGELMPNHFGKCDKIGSCGYELRPKKEAKKKVEEPVKEQINYIYDKAVELSCNPDFYGTNGLFTFLSERFPKEDVTKVFQKYNIGTTRDSRTIFWHKDFEHNYRQGQVIDYVNGHSQGAQTSATSLMKLKGKFKQCIFGEHLLLSFSGKKVNFVESPKTALICELSLGNKNTLWLSHINITGLSSNKVHPIRHLLGDKEISLYNDFHFQARMINGIIPKRVKGGVMSLDGDLVECIHKKELLGILTNYTSTVTFVDICPNSENGGDIADVILGEIEVKAPEPKVKAITCTKCQSKVIEYAIINGLCTDCCIISRDSTKVEEVEKQSLNTIKGNIQRRSSTPDLKVINSNFPILSKLKDALGLEVESITNYPNTTPNWRVKLTPEKIKSGEDSFVKKDIYKFFSKILEPDYGFVMLNARYNLNEFCKKHSFSLIETEKNFNIVPF